MGVVLSIMTEPQQRPLEKLLHMLLVRVITKVCPGPREENIDAVLNGGVSMSHGKKSMWGGRYIGAAIFGK